MHVASDRFEATVRALGALVTYVSLRELVERHRAGRSTRGLAAVTFDDAYVSVVAEAWPVMQELEMHVTLFVTSEAARTGAPFWWDRLEEAFAAVSVERWHAFERQCGVPESFRLGQPAEMGRLRPLRQWILAEHRGRWPAALEEALTQLEADAGTHPSQRPLTYAELDELVRTGLVDVGSHSATHPVLPLLPDDEIRQEIRASFARLRARYPNTVQVLAPPFGLYDERTVRIGREEGLTCCVTLEATLLSDGAAADTMPRIGMMAGHQPWKAVLFALGCWHRVRPRRDRHHRYPDLPSAST